MSGAIDKAAGIARAPFGTMPDGTAIECFTLANGRGVELRVLTYGGIIASCRVPDRHGEPADVVLGHDDLDGYLHRTQYFGALIGRYGNRIARGRFTLDGVEYRLPVNNGPNHLHGGTGGFDTVVWRAAPVETPDGVALALAYTSPDGEMGYPGTLEARVVYTLTRANELVVDYGATTDRATPVNLTQHSYWNLGGVAAGMRDVLDHEVWIAADRYTPVDDTLIPTGELAPVEGTPFDFREPVPIGARVDLPDAQLRHAGGYDHNFVLRRGDDGLAPAARVVERTSGRTLEVLTTEPGLQFYSGNFLDGSIRGKNGCVYAHRTGLCLETQHFPNSPNEPRFPSTILRPGERYRSRTVFRFGTTA